MYEVGYGPNDPVIAHPKHGQVHESLLQITYTSFFTILKFSMMGVVYSVGVVAIMEYTQLESRNIQFLIELYDVQKFFVAFFLALFLNTGFTVFRQDWARLGTLLYVISDLYVSIRLWLPDDDEETQHEIRDLIVASTWAMFSGIMGNGHNHSNDKFYDEATLRIRSYVKDDADYNRLVELGKQNKYPIGMSPAMTLLLLAAQKYDQNIVDSVHKVDFKDKITKGTQLYGVIQGSYGDGNAFSSAYMQLIMFVVMSFLLIYPWTAYASSSNSGWWTVLVTGNLWMIVMGMLEVGCDMFFPYQGNIRLNVPAYLNRVEATWKIFAPYDKNKNKENYNKTSA